MKKIIIFLSVSVLLLAVIPIVGNQLVQETLNSKIENLKSQGVEVTSTSDGSYLVTKNHYEFLVNDSDKFISYLNSFSNEQLPKYVDALVDGVLVGADLEYSNIPFREAVSIDIYPLSLSKEMNKNLDEDVDLKKYIDGFLKSKGILYHINYNIVSEDFDGYIKDIKEKYITKENIKLSFELSDADYHGNGKLIAPNLLIATVENMSLHVEDKQESLLLNLKSISTTSNFESQSTYLTSFGLKSLELNALTEDNAKIDIKSSDIKANISSNTQGKYAEISTKSSFKDLVVNSQEVNFVATNFNYDLSLSDVDKDLLEELRVMFSKLQNDSSVALQNRIQESLITLLSKGLKVYIPDLSLENIQLNGSENLEGFQIISSTTLKEDKNLGQKINYAPLLIVQSVDTDMKIKLSKKIFSLISNSTPMVSMIESYAKEEGSSLVFELTFKNGEFRINGKALVN